MAPPINPITQELFKILQTDEKSLAKLYNLIQYCCYFYEQTGLPSPMKVDITAELRQYKFKVIDAKGDPYFDKMIAIFKIDKLDENRINKFLAYLKYMSDTVSNQLQIEFKYFRLDFRIMVIIIYQLVGKENFMSVFRSQYPYFHARFFDSVFYDVFLKIVEQAFKGTQCNIKFTAPTTEAPQLAQPGELDSLLRKLFAQCYVPAPFRFLYTLISAYNCQNLLQVAHIMKTQTLEQQNKELKTEVILHERVIFKIFGRGLVKKQVGNVKKLQQDIQEFVESRKKPTQLQTLYCDKSMVVHLDKNDREDERTRYLNSLLFKKGLLEQSIDNGRIIRTFTPKMNEVRTRNLQYSMGRFNDQQSATIQNSNNELMNGWFGPIIVDKEVKDIELEGLKESQQEKTVEEQ